MADRQLPSIDLLRQLLRYDPETGKLFWLVRPVSMFTESSCKGTANRSAEWAHKSWNTRCAGNEAFTADSGKGYRQGSIFGRTYKAHRVIFALVYGAWPSEEVDHENVCGGDNRLTNLRAATSSQNKQNRRRAKHNTSGFKGVSWHRRKGKWAASIKMNGRQKHLGYFESGEAAHQAYLLAAQESQGVFARAQ
ncbi:HNH endonuclease [Shinella sp.]|uniref:HNH endonuclease n=1 Tax=Shinella sp. TaxID=1870904 RepID=UPI0028986BFF|nr:HNH endonuclease [Shinella sp.]